MGGVGVGGAGRFPFIECIAGHAEGGIAGQRGAAADDRVSVRAIDTGPASLCGGIGADVAARLRCPCRTATTTRAGPGSKKMPLSTALRLPGSLLMVNWTCPDTL